MVTVELPEKVKQLAETLATEAGYANVGEYIARLIIEERWDGPPICMSRRSMMSRRCCWNG
jgi:hypothetical protein